MDRLGRREGLDLDPAAAMRAEAGRRRVPPGVRVVGGEGERVPLRSPCRTWPGCRGVKNRADMSACAVELRAVVVDAAWANQRGVSDGTARWGSTSRVERAIEAFPSTGGSRPRYEAGFRLHDRGSGTRNRRPRRRPPPGAQAPPGRLDSAPPERHEIAEVWRSWTPAIRSSRWSRRASCCIASGA